MAIDWSFIRELEGFRTDVYVPQEEGKPLDKSGPTVGSGVDLGQMSEADLDKLDISSSLKEKLKPYLKGNYPKDRVIEYVEQENPLELSEEEAAEITESIKRREKTSVEKWYNKNNKVGQSFSDLSDREQTVITSIGFQYGSSFKGAPKFGSYILNDDWSSATEELRNFNDKYPTRRHKELNYLVGKDQVDDEVTPETLRKMESFVQSQKTKGPQQMFAQSMESREGSEPLTQEGTQESIQDGVRPFLNNLTQYISQQLNGPSRGSQERETASSQGESGYTEQEEKLIGSIAQRMETQHNDSIRTEGEAKLERKANEAKLAETARAAQQEVQEGSPEPTPQEESMMELTPEEEKMLGKMFKGQASQEPQEKRDDRPVQMLF